MAKRSKITPEEHQENLRKAREWSAAHDEETKAGVGGLNREAKKRAQNDQLRAEGRVAGHLGALLSLTTSVRSEIARTDADLKTLEKCEKKLHTAGGLFIEIAALLNIKL